MSGKRTLLSQGEVRPGVVQGQYWREIDYGPRYIDGPDGERWPVYTIDGHRRMVATRPTPSRRADPRLSHKVTR